MAGYRVVEAADSRQAMHELERQDIDMVAASLDLPEGGGFAFLEQIKRVPTLAGIPVLALAGREGERPPLGKHAAEFEDFQVKFDRQGVLRSLSKLSEGSEECDQEPALVGEKG